jgi:hypothetical protein
MFGSVAGTRGSHRSTALADFRMTRQDLHEKRVDMTVLSIR